MLKNMKTGAGLLILAAFLILPLRSMAQQPELSPGFEKIYEWIAKKDFFTARDLFLADGQALSPMEQQLSAAFIDNAFNRPAESNAHIERLFLEFKAQLPDSVLRELYQIKHQNAVRLYQYGEAAEALNALLNEHPEGLTEKDEDDVRNSLKLWNAVKDVPSQEVLLGGGVEMQMVKDKAGLNNLEVSSGEITELFIFDTGANISTVTLSTAERFGMKMTADTIEVGTITGQSVFARLALCEHLRLGQAVIRNAIFLVLEDEALSFPQVDYHIRGIIGFPVMEALGEIQISREGVFRVPLEETPFPGEQNLAMDKLQPLIRIDGRHYRFDTGADRSLLFRPYFEAFRKEIEEHYTLAEVRYGGAGGVQTFQGYSLPFRASIQGKSIEIEQVDLLVEDIREGWSAMYGNIGQDLIEAFEMMTINFNRMFIRFD